MSDKIHAHKRRLEAAMLARDGWRLRSSIRLMIESSNSGFIDFALAPYLAFYVIEGYDWLRQLPNLRSIDLFHGHDRELRALRARIKGLEGHRESMRGIVAESIACERHSIEWFNRSHKGLLGPLKRWRQPDLGVFFYKNQLVYTTHLGLAFTSFGQLDTASTQDDPMEALGKQAHWYSRLMGRFLALITDALVDHFPQHAAPAPPNNNDTPGFQDWKATQFYSRLCKHTKLQRPNVTALLVLVSQVNMTYHVLPTLFEERDDLLFRAQFLTIYAACRGMLMMTADPDVRNTSISARIAAISRTPEARTFRRIAPKVRNIVAHYKLETQSDLSMVSHETDTLKHIIDTVAPTSRRDCEQIMQPLLAQMSETFREIVSPVTSSRPVRFDWNEQK